MQQIFVCLSPLDRPQLRSCVSTHHRSHLGPVMGLLQGHAPNESSRPCTLLLVRPYAPSPRPAGVGRVIPSPIALIPAQPWALQDPSNLYLYSPDFHRNNPRFYDVCGTSYAPQAAQNRRIDLLNVPLLPGK